MIHFSLFRIPVTIQPFFWVTLIVIGALSRNVDSPQELLELATFVLAGTLSILVHELGHALTIKSYRVPTSITLQAFGGYATYPARSLNRLQSFLVTAAGPALQLVLALVAYVVSNRLPEENGLQIFLADLILVSVFWAILNLLPILPLDGGQLVNALLGPKRIKVTLWVTIIAGVAFGLGGLLFTGSIMLPVFFGMYAYQAFQALREINGR